ncbi:hypothetical protein MLD38_022070 [Melastoma candidum]|uniref:Uncharacterized protein n=1 Tax=Melastoma candidum TaxID=119954 RepID=A0ACB9QIJ7_9MYRT|nr:hypothetical protein MLD38_022070 [Melastoma candidum]
MGNCIRHESPMHWGGDDWGPTFSRSDDADDPSCDQVVVKGKIESRGMGPGTWSRSTEVKIRITKKQLEELLRKLDVKDKVSVQQAMSRLVRMSEQHGRSRRPALKSISEI